MAVTRIMDTRIVHRTDTAENWHNINPILIKGELGLESDTNLFKIGSGKHRWVDLPYANDFDGNLDVSLTDIKQSIENLNTNINKRFYDFNERIVNLQKKLEIKIENINDDLRFHLEDFNNPHRVPIQELEDRIRDLQDQLNYLKDALLPRYRLKKLTGPDEVDADVGTVELNLHLEEE